MHAGTYIPSYCNQLFMLKFGTVTFVFSSEIVNYWYQLCVLKQYHTLLAYHSAMRKVLADSREGETGESFLANHPR